MKLAFIASTPVLDMTLPGDIDMALAHLVLTDTQYERHFKQSTRGGRYVILDNGAFEMQEQGKGVTPSDLLAAAAAIGASEVICPDVLYDGGATATATYQFLDLVGQMKSGGRFKTMAVVQGRTKDEFLACYQILSRHPNLDRLGFSKLAVPLCFGKGLLRESRIRALKTVELMHRTGPGLPRKAIHLLGGDQSLPGELVEHFKEKNQRVESLDSSFAYWYGAAKMRIDLETLIAEQMVPGPIDFQRNLSPSQRWWMRSHMKTLLQCAHGQKVDAEYPKEEQPA